MKIKDITLDKNLEDKFDSAMREFTKHYSINENFFKYEKENYNERNYTPLMFKLVYVPTGRTVFYYDSSYIFQVAEDAINDEEFSKIVEFNLLPKFKEYGTKVLSNILPLYRCRLFNLPVRILRDEVVFNDDSLTTYYDLYTFSHGFIHNTYKFNISNEEYALLLKMIEVEEVK